MKETMVFEKTTPRRIENPQSTLPLLKSIQNKKQETMLVILLNTAHEVIKKKVVSIGTVNKTIVHPRDVYIEAIKKNATCLILAHNHPSGSTIPSAEDKAITQTIKDAGELLLIPLLDHIIISKRGYYSFQENNTL